jgi:hypothetical protein
MSNELPLSTSRKVKAFKLSDLTCAGLADILEQPASTLVREPARLRELRSRLGSAFYIQCLRLAGDAPAIYWRSKILSAALIASAPAVKLVIGAGIPATIGQAHARFTKRAAVMAAKSGITLHRYRGQAFTVLKSTPPPRKTSLQMKPDLLIQLTRRAGQATRRSLKRCQTHAVNGCSIAPQKPLSSSTRRSHATR